MENIIEIKNLTKIYKNFKTKKEIVALDNVSFNVKKGEIFGFLGQNGAGKSTLIGILTTMKIPSSGSATICGLDVVKDEYKVRKQFGIVFQSDSLEPNQTVYWNVRFQAELYNIPKDEIESEVDKALELVDLINMKDQRASKLSGGQKRRLELARSLIQKPKILFLDEPTAGVDPQTRESIWTKIVDLSKKLNITIFLTTHYMEETEICDRIGIIVGGKLKQIDTKDKLKKSFGLSKIIIPFLNNKQIIILKSKFKHYKNIDKENNNIIIYVEEIKNSYLVELSKILKIDIDKIEFEKSKMQDTFINIIEGGK